MAATATTAWAPASTDGARSSRPDDVGSAAEGGPCAAVASVLGGGVVVVVLVVDVEVDVVVGGTREAPRSGTTIS